MFDGTFKNGNIIYQMEIIIQILIKITVPARHREQVEEAKCET